MAENNVLYDGNPSFLGGANELDQFDDNNSYYRGVNLRIDENSLRQRYAYHDFDIKTINPKDQVLYDRGRLQAFAPVPNTSYVIEVISGRFFKTSLISKRSVLLKFENPDDHGNELYTRVNWSYAGKFMFFSQGPDNNIIYEINTGILRRTNLKRIYTDISPDPNVQDQFISTILPLPEAPPSDGATFNSDRLFIYKGFLVQAGDPIGTFEDAPITFRESLAPNTDYIGESYSVGTSTPYEFITAMGFLKVLDNTTEYGALFASTNNHIYTAPASTPRSTWIDGRKPFFTLAAPNVSIAGGRAFANVGNDLFFIDSMGKLRSLSTSVENSKRWDDLSVSKRIQKQIEIINASGVKFTCLEYWNGKLFAFVKPQLFEAETTFGRKVEDYYFKGMIVLDFTNNSDFNTQVSPSYYGMWTGIEYQDMAVVGQKLFLKGRVNGKNKIFYVNPHSVVDLLENKAKLIKSRLYTSPYSFKNIYIKKELKRVQIDLSDIETSLDVSVSYTPNKNLDYALYKNFKINHSPKKNILDALKQPSSYSSLVVGEPEENPCQPGSGDSYNIATEFMLRFDFEGSFKLSNIALTGMARREAIQSDINCSTMEPKIIDKKCDSISDENYYNIGHIGKDDVC